MCGVVYCLTSVYRYSETNLLYCSFWNDVLG